jgi:hypothetical protein
MLLSEIINLLRCLETYFLLFFLFNRRCFGIESGGLAEIEGPDLLLNESNHGLIQVFRGLLLTSLLVQSALFLIA